MDPERTHLFIHPCTIRASVVMCRRESARARERRGKRERERERERERSGRERSLLTIK
jgi:hypothetical protein